MGSIPASGPFNGVTATLSNLNSTLTRIWGSDDEDQDGMDDDWELKFFGDLDQTATNDFDLDGQDDLSEYIAGTNPTNSTSLFRLTSTSGADQFMLHWPSFPNRVYDVYWTPNLEYTAFQLVEANLVYPRDSLTNAPDSIQGYFRVDVQKP